MCFINDELDLTQLYSICRSKKNKWMYHRYTSEPYIERHVKGILETEKSFQKDLEEIYEQNQGEGENDP